MLHPYRMLLASVLGMRTAANGTNSRTLGPNSSSPKLIGGRVANPSAPGWPEIEGVGQRFFRGRSADSVTFAQRSGDSYTAVNHCIARVTDVQHKRGRGRDGRRGWTRRGASGPLGVKLTCAINS